MKLERFFEKFEQLADTANAVGKMRELILHLAVHGKLVEQLDGDEPASDLLSRSRAEMAILMASGKAKREKPAAPVLKKEVAFSLPRGWVWCRLVDAGQFINGLAFKPSDWGSVGRPIIRIQNLSGRNLEYNRTAGDFDPSVLVQDGDILVSWSATLDAFIWRGEEGVLNQHIFRVLPASLADKGYIFWLLKWVIRQLAESDHAHGLVMSHINRGPFLACPIPLPPLAEQKRIVAKVDELMALCDRLEAQQQERDTRHVALARASLARFAEAPTPANLDFIFHKSYPITPSDLRKSILTLAVQGKLVPQDPNDEPTDELLAQCLAERQKYKRVASTSVQTIAGEDALGYDIPSSWRWQVLDDLLIFGPTNGFSPKAVDYETPVCSLTLSATTSGKFKGQHSKFITTDVPPESELWLRDGDILVQRGNSIEYVGVSAVYRGEPNRFVYPDLMMKFRVSSALDVGFIHLAMSQDAARSYLRARASGTSGSMPKINQTTLKSLPLPIPPLAEQHRIVAKVDQLMALVDQLETQLAAAKSKSAALLESVICELLNPSAEVIDLASYRAAIGCYTIKKMSDKPYFGRTAAMKMFYLAQVHVGMPLGLQPEREAAGPLDPWIYRFEDAAKQQGWFKAVQNTSNGKMKVEYQPGKTLAEQAAQGETLLNPEQRKELDRMLGLLSDKKTEEVEIIATLFAAWNDFLIDGHAPSDDEIVTEVRENWHQKKERFTPAHLRQWLGWMRKNKLVPQGRPPRTVQQSKLLLN